MAQGSRRRGWGREAGQLAGSVPGLRLPERDLQGRFGAGAQHPDTEHTRQG